MKVVSITTNDRVKSHAQVTLEGGTQFCLPLKRLSILDITEGCHIDDSRIQYIIDYEVYAAAKADAVKYIATKMRTCYEVEKKLFQLGYEENCISRVVEDLIEINYLDDLKYANCFISDRNKLKPTSSRLMRMELKHRGIEDSIIDIAMSGQEQQDENVAYTFLQKKYSKYTDFDDKLILKMKNFLAARGFEYSQISYAVEKFIECKTSTED